ncbi:MAG: Cell division protein DivIB [Candidatus Magasanikbacteria bacterium GW2011_GWA2_37_8]|uniref:Cell division protein DivIB n=1 Tax=Candidatus Magasanikbacteria bacterium GW2011_GWA2_37_8 TaxID=1619036 RepID=A0A0G0HRF9_9BACT|nr:MAG: Cell division protein DivIB [Candidatus Magasanikbacteria bacterium GW2011_GWA2_37_8]
MPRFFYSHTNFQHYKPKENLWRRWLKYRERKKMFKRQGIKWKNSRHPYKTEVASIRKIITTIVLTALFIGWIILILFLPYFRIQKINYDGLKIIKQAELDIWFNDKLFSGKIIPWNNYFLVSTNNLTNKAISHFGLEAIEIRKIFPHELKIVIKEKISSVIYDNGQNYYLLDNNGYSIKYLGVVGDDEFKTIPINTTTVSSTTKTKNVVSSTFSNTTTTEKIHLPNFSRLVKDFGDFPIIFDKRKINISENILVIEPEIIQTALDWQRETEKQGIGRVKYFVLDNPAAGLTVYTYKPWVVYINIYKPVNGQIDNLKLITITNQPKEYIDVRYGERVYWK